MSRGLRDAVSEAVPPVRGGSDEGLTAEIYAEEVCPEQAPAEDIPAQNSGDDLSETPAKAALDWETRDHCRDLSQSQKSTDAVSDGRRQESPGDENHPISLLRPPSPPALPPSALPGSDESRCVSMIREAGAADEINDHKLMRMNSAHSPGSLRNSEGAAIAPRFTHAAIDQCKPETTPPLPRLLTVSTGASPTSPAPTSPRASPRAAEDRVWASAGSSPVDVELLERRKKESTSESDGRGGLASQLCGITCDINESMTPGSSEAKGRRGWTEETRARLWMTWGYAKGVCGKRIRYAASYFGETLASTLPTHAVARLRTLGTGQYPDAEGLAGGTHSHTRLHTQTPSNITGINQTDLEIVSGAADKPGIVFLIGSGSRFGRENALSPGGRNRSDLGRWLEWLGWRWYRREQVRQGVLICSLIAGWYVVSLLITACNKILLDALAFPYPLFVTFVHLAGVALLARSAMLLVYGSESVVSVEPCVYVASILPVAFASAMEIALTNEAYRLISLSLITVLKSTLVATTYVGSIIAGFEKASLKLSLVIVWIIASIALSVPGFLRPDSGSDSGSGSGSGLGGGAEIRDSRVGGGAGGIGGHADPNAGGQGGVGGFAGQSLPSESSSGNFVTGTIILMMSIVCASVRWVLVHKQLKSSGYTSLSLISLIQPLAALCLFPAVLILDVPPLVHNMALETIGADRQLAIMILLFAAVLLVCLLLFIEFKLIEVTSSLTLTVAGVGKECCTIIMSIVRLSDLHPRFELQRSNTHNMSQA